MANSIVHSNGFIELNVPAAFEKKAQVLRAQRDQKYGNIYTEQASDLRWVGDLGEIAFKSWLNHSGVAGAKWQIEDAAGREDFLLPTGEKIGVKTVKRKVPPTPEFTAQVTAQHANEPVDEFFFLCYQFQINKMWFLGGIRKEAFLSKAKYYKAGECVHPAYQIRPGHEIYNIAISELIPPNEWLSTRKL